MSRAILTLCVCAVGHLASSAAQPPNVVVFLADDLGFSDLGCYGGEIETPNLDRLAENGLRYSQFYNTARCWPTRGALMTGYYAQHIRRDTLPGIERGNRPIWATLLPARLKALGYRSYHSGKWHIDGMPVQNGFDRSYYLQDQGRFFHPQTHYVDDARLPPVAPNSGYYGTTAVVDSAISHLQDHAANHPGTPFFQYVAFAAPHFPLHALPADIEKYQDRYLVGWDKIRTERWNRINGLGMIPGELSAVERQVGPPYHFPAALEILGDGEVNRPLAWNELTNEQQHYQASKMAIHAAMIDRVDQEIGRVLAQIKKMNAWDDTLIFFLSDNGASAEIMVRDDGHDPDAEAGSAATYLCLGPGWSTVANTPFRRHKTWTHEGGISTPLIVHWPAGIHEKGEWRHTPGHVVDFVPTILQVGDRNAFDVQAFDPPLAGRSLLATFREDTPKDEREIWWSHEGNNALRRGDWKLVAASGSDWELYNLKVDRAETRDAARLHPHTVRELELAWESQANQLLD